jgi:lipoprotein-anchoring transpeptidase ErfK/SrfK
LKYTPIIVAAIALAGCQNKQSDERQKDTTTQADRSNPLNGLLFADAGGDVPPLPSPLALLQAQVVLDRAGFSSGVLDGKDSDRWKAALRGFQNANGLEESGTFDAATQAALGKMANVPATRRVRIPAAFAQQTFVPDFPEDAAEQAKLPALGYRNLMEALAERFHTTPETLVALNSVETLIGAGRVIVVPNIADAALAGNTYAERGWDKTLAMLGVAAEQPEIASILVDKSESWLRALDADGKIVAQFPVTTGSSHDPLPLGNWTIKGVARNPEFHYNPELFWDVSDSKDKQLLQPGPNGPVGVVWIDLSKPHYGIHGTGEPATIGSAESHGCVRLTNWDAARLAGMVKPGTKVLFRA